MRGEFTQKAKDVINKAQYSASYLGHNYVGTEHILLGLVSIDNSVAYKALEMQNISENAVEENIIKINKGLSLSAKGTASFTPKAKKVLELSLNESIRLGSNSIGTEHLLLSILKETDSVAVKILKELKINIQRLHDSILMLLGESSRSMSGAPMGKFKTQNVKSTTPTLDKFSRNFSTMASEEKFDPTIGRDKEIERLIQILSRRSKNNPCLIGDPGVGKTAIVEGLALKIHESNVPESLKDKKVVALDLASMIAGSKYRGEFEDRIKKVLAEVKNSNNIILFIDELHTVVGAGAAEGAIDASNILKPSLARGEIQVIGATTIDEYRKHIEKDVALERRFQPVKVEEPSEEKSIDMLKGLRKKYEEHHKVKITNLAIETAVKLSSRYITDRFLPDKAIDLIDEAGAKIKLGILTDKPEIKQLKDKLLDLEKDKEEAIKLEQFEHAGSIKKEQIEIKEKLERLKDSSDSNKSNKHPTVDENIIASIVSNWTGIPVYKLQKDETKKLLRLEKTLHNRVIGQEYAVTSVAKAIRRGRVGLKNPKKPIGSFLFLGPTGVGKTELSKALSEAVFGDENAIIRIDMSEYMEKHSISKLIGSPPGYVGYDDTGQCTEKIRRNPYSVVLFDEIEKAHPDVFNILLQVLDDGHISDSHGKKIDFKNTIIIMTSNAGAKNIISPKKLGFTSYSDEDKSYEDMKKSVMDEIKNIFKPEFLNRIDDIIVFHALNEDSVKKIVKLMLNEFIKRAKSNLNITITISNNVINYLAKKGFDKDYGARPLRRVIQNKIEDELALRILDGSFKEGDIINIEYLNKVIKFIKKSKKHKVTK